VLAFKRGKRKSRERFVHYAVIENNLRSNCDLKLVFYHPPTVLRFAQDTQIAKKHGRTPQAFAAAF